MSWRSPRPGPVDARFAWLLRLAPNVLLMPGTGSIAQLHCNLAAETIRLDRRALRALDRVGA